MSTHNYFGTDLVKGMVLETVGNPVKIVALQPYYELASEPSLNPSAKFMNADHTKTLLTIRDAKGDNNSVHRIVVIDNSEEFPVIES